MKLKKNIINYLKKQVNKTGYQIKKANNFIFLDSILNKLVSHKGDINFIQIGGNDGINFDPLYHFIILNKSKISGYVLEPVKDYFNELVNNYKDLPLIKPLNLAIHNNQSEMVIHRVNSKNPSVLPSYAKGIASFNEAHHVSCKIPSEYMIQEKVKCISLENLLIEKKIGHVDLLQIDTEGYDAEIILNINFEKWKPSIINFEYYVQNPISREILNTIIDKLHLNGYEIWMEVNDITAYQRDLFIKID